jgi:hypothetical protein
MAQYVPASLAPDRVRAFAEDPSVVLLVAGAEANLAG